MCHPKLHYLSTVVLIFALTIYSTAQASQVNRWVSIIPDSVQYHDKSVPVIVGGMVLSSDKKYSEKSWVKSIRIENRSPKTVVLLKLRWFATTVEDVRRERILEKGEITPISVSIMAGASEQLETPLPNLTKNLKKWIEENPNSKGFMITISTNEVLYEDATSWKAGAMK
jgi:hypothetical protein